MRVLLVSGSTRSASTNTATLRTAVRLAPPDLEAVLYQGLERLPAFNPDDDREPLHPAVAKLRGAIGAADAVLFCTPEYAGALPGSLKNLLDWTVGGSEMDGKPVAWINVAAAGRGLRAHESLAIVLDYISGATVEAACLPCPVARDAVGPDGTVTDPAVREHLTGVLLALRDHLLANRPA